MSGTLKAKQLKLGELGGKLEHMTAQEVFDSVVGHLFGQGVKSMVGLRCKYNGDGACCAAAPFIMVYQSNMENCDWVTVASDSNFISKKHLSLIYNLQKVHDAHYNDNEATLAFDLEVLARELSVVAEKFNLSTPNSVAVDGKEPFTWPKKQ